GDKQVLADAYRGLGRAYLATGAVDKGLRELRKALAEDPDDPDAALALAEALLGDPARDPEEGRGPLERPTRGAPAAPPAPARPPRGPGPRPGRSGSRRSPSGPAPRRRCAWPASSSAPAIRRAPPRACSTRCASSPATSRRAASGRRRSVARWGSPCPPAT